MNKLSTQVGAEVSFFRTKLYPMVSYQKNETTILIPPIQVQSQTSEKTDSAITVDGIAKELASGFQKITRITNLGLPDFKFSWPPQAEALVKGLSVELKGLYLLVRIKSQSSNSENPPQEKDVSIDFACHLLVKATQELQEAFPIQIDQLSLKVWNTTNQSVLDRMEIFDLDKFLENSVQENT